MKHKCSSLPNNLLVFLATTTLHWFWSSASNHSRLFYLWQNRSNFCFRFVKSFTTSSLHLFFDHLLVLTPTGLRSVILITSFISSILCTCSHHLTLCAFTYLTLSSPFINFFNLLLLLILYLSLHGTGPISS
jgi:hypothetical protein